MGCGSSSAAGSHPKATAAARAAARRRSGAWARSSSFGILGNLVQLHEDVTSIEKYYDIGGNLGEGTYGSVRMATEKKTGRTVAIKTIPIDETSAEQITTEIRMLRQIKHPNIIRLYDIYNGPSQVHIAMEYCSGGDAFDKWASSDHQLPEEKVKLVIMKLCSALAYLHGKNFVHRDVKIENMLFTTKEADAEVMLCDFGMGENGQKLSGAKVKGTLQNLAPEVFRGEMSSAVDMWATGVVTYELISGQDAFGGSNIKEIIQSIKSKSPTFAHPVFKKISKDCVAFIKQLLNKDPAKRMTAKQALLHPWFDPIISPETRGRRTTVDQQEVTELMVAYSNMPVMRQHALLVIAFLLDPAKVQSRRAVFDQIDADNTGSISRSEFKAALSKRSSMEGVDADKLFDAVDKERTGKVNYLEFLAATVPSSCLDDERTLRAAFDRLDSSRTGYITSDDLKEVMGRDYAIADVAEMIASADFQEDKRISYVEFVRMIRGEEAAVGLNDVGVALEGTRK